MGYKGSLSSQGHKDLSLHRNGSEDSGKSNLLTQPWSLCSQKSAPDFGEIEMGHTGHPGAVLSSVPFEVVWALRTFTLWPLSCNNVAGDSHGTWAVSWAHAHLECEL